MRSTRTSAPRDATAPSPARSTATPPATPPHARPAATLTAAALALFLVDLDFFALNMALPPMARDLSVSVTDLQWVISGYMLALGAFLIPGGRLGDVIGRRRTLIVGVAIVFAAAIGIAFGYLPARRAARLDPIEALRHE